MTEIVETIKSDPQVKVREAIYESASLDRSYLLMNVLAAMIASYGLFANSPAVVIGAMIVAMLLGPITGISLALVDSNVKVLMQSLRSLVVGALVVLLTSFLIGYIHRDIPITNEVLARTSPNLIDLMVALAGGAAGAYATVSPRLSVAFVGVAISTALVPPLCAASILFARNEIHLGLGAVLLTFTNMVAIQFSSSVVFWCSGFHRLSKTGGLSFLAFITRNFLSILILGVLTVMLASSLKEAVAKQVFESHIRFILAHEINASVGSHLSEVRFSNAQSGKYIVKAVIGGPNPPSPQQIAALEAKLSEVIDDRKVELIVRFVQTKIIGREGVLYENVEFGTTELL